MAAGFEPIETASVDELRALQRERLAWSINHAYTGNAHFARACAATGVTPAALKSLDDLQHFPFTTKADLRAAYPFGYFAVPQDQIARIHASSGTTGKPTVVGYTKNDIATWARLIARSIYAAGGRPGMKAHIAYGYGLFTGGLGAHYGAELLGCTVIPMSGGQTERQVQLICDFAPEIIMVTPSYLLALLDEWRRRALGESSLKIAILGAEPWGEGIRAEIERGFGVDAVDIYGLSEVMGPGVAQECVETKDGLTLWEDHFYPEIVDPDTGRVLPEGETGELVLTSLTKEAMPVIRYRTRDITRLQPGTARTMRRIARIAARTDDMVIVRGVNVFPSQIEEQIAKCTTLAPHYVIEVARAGRLDELRVRVEARDNVDIAAAHELGHHIKAVVGITAIVDVLQPGTLERSQGKAKRVIDKRGP